MRLKPAYTVADITQFEYWKLEWDSKPAYTVADITQFESYNLNETQISLYSCGHHSIWILILNEAETSLCSCRYHLIWILKTWMRLILACTALDITQFESSLEAWMRLKSAGRVADITQFEYGKLERDPNQPVQLQISLNLNITTWMRLLPACTVADINSNLENLNEA